ncbi:hypothetical protein [Halosegnis sp.]|uniref:hypothetical protein n=1 Tax=Halosegnis sp. TaxID=2864959 RepID=UPI0035D47F80
MSAAGRSDAPAPAESVAVACRNAGLVRLTATADGDALAALGQLGAALRAAGVPFHASVAPFPAAPATDADLTVAFGSDGGDVAVTDGPLSATAYDAARALGADPDPLLAMAGAVAAGHTPGGDMPFYEAAQSQLTRRPGVATPVADPVDGLAHSTLVHAGFSGDPAATGDALARLSLPESLDETAHRQLASLVAVTATADATKRATEQIERSLRPYAGGPFHTLGGYADVLDACARTAPGLGVALAVGTARGEGDSAHATEALTAWRDHGQTAHAALHEGATARHDGLFVVRTSGDAPLGTVARLAWAFRSPEPLALAVGGKTAALYGTDAADLARDLARATPAEAVARATSGRITGIETDRLETEVRRLT